MTDVDKSFLENMTGYCVKNAYHKFLDHADAGLSEFDLKVPEFSILALIEQNSGITQTKLIENLYVTRSTASELVERLVKRKLVLRKAINRKSHGLMLSKKGDDFYKKVLIRAVESESELTRNFTNAEVQQLKKLLLKLADNL